MQVSNIMTRRVISVVPDETIDAAIELMLKHHISGLPVIDDKGELVGIVTEGDFLRRPETSTEHRTGSRWRDAFFNFSKVTDNYIHTHGVKVKDVMTPNPVAVAEDTPLDEVVGLMQTRNVKRLPVRARRQGDRNHQPRQLDARVGEHSPRGPRSRER